MVSDPHSLRRQLLYEALGNRVLILDGSLGVSFQRLSLTEEQMRSRELAHHPVPLAGNFDILNITAPHIVGKVHRGFLEAGADIIETNTFNSQALSQSEYHTAHLVSRLNEQGARIARRIADEFTVADPSRPRFVAGSIGPTAYTLSMRADLSDNQSASEVDFDSVSDAMAEQAAALIRGGVDLLLVETIFDALNVKATLAGIRQAQEAEGVEVPVILSVTLSDTSRRLFTGQTPEAFIAALAYCNPLAVGFNCSGGPESLVDSVRRLNEVSPFRTILYPNAGLPDALGNYSATPDSFAAALKPLLDDAQLNIVGGCCGTMPDHIEALARVAAGAPPRCPHHVSPAWLAALEPFDPQTGVFVNVGERCNVAGSRKFLRLIREKAYDQAVEVAVSQVRAGAMMLDINLDDAMLDGPAEMAAFLRLLSADVVAASVPWMVDSSQFSVIEVALRNIGGKAVVNSISLRHGEQEFLQQAEIIRSYGAAVLVMLFDEQGQAATYHHKIRVARRAYTLLTGAGWNPRDIIIDPNVLTVATGIDDHNIYALDFIRAVAWIKKNLPGVRTSGGVSNLSFAFRGNNYLRQAMHAVFLYHAIAAGLDMAIVDPTSRVVYDAIDPDLLLRLEDVILNRRPDATDRLTAVAARYASAAAEPSSARPDRILPLPDRMREALLAGDTSAILSDLPQALSLCADASSVISQILMPGMDCIGHLFGEGRLFLPQVVKSARTMQAAVDWLRPYMEQSASVAPARATFIIATVKGDVHDIGKNIAAVVMRCNNFRVIDLGVQVDATAIVEAVCEHHPDFIGLSGLITPSLHEMALTLRALHQAGISLPVFVGGAATSRIHTALKLAPEYPSGVVVHVSDAAQNALKASALIDDYDSAAAMLRSEYAQVVADYYARTASAPLPVLRPRIDWSVEPRPRPSYLGCRNIDGLTVADVRPLINWRYFLHCWRTGPDTPEAHSLIADAEDLLDSISGMPMLARVGFYSARGAGDAILAGDYTIPTPRQQPSPSREESLSLCDFVAPDSDYIGVFCVTIGEPVRRLLNAPADDYRRLLLQSVTDRLAEAASEHLHWLTRTDLWGYAPDEIYDPVHLCGGKYRGIRPAVGYGCLPDQSLMHTLSRMVDMSQLQVSVTENGALWPSSSVAGFYIACRHSRYFTV